MAKWRAVGETEGLVTLPPDRNSIDIAGVTISLADPGHASAANYLAPLRSAYGATIQAPMKGLVRLDLRTSVDAPTEEVAQDIAYVAMEHSLNLVLLASGGSAAPVRVTEVLEQNWTLGHRRLLHASTVFSGIVTSWQPAHADRINSAEQAMNNLSDEDKERLGNALTWLRKSSVVSDVGVHYLFLWFALESLSQMGFVQAKSAGPKCSNPKCGKKLRCAVCNREQAPKQPVKTRELLVALMEIWSSKQYNDRWKLRSSIAHGGIALTPAQEQRTNELIEPMRETVRHALMYALNFPSGTVRS